MSVLVPNLAFSNEDAKHYLEAEQLTGFSSATFTTWHRLGRKMDADILRGYFKECGMTNITAKNLLGGMVVAVSGQHGKPN